MAMYQRKKIKEDIEKMNEEGESAADKGLQDIQNSRYTIWIIVAILAFIGAVIWFIAR